MIINTTRVAAIAAGLFAGILHSMACTSLIAAKGATDDGSVMITYAADSHTLYGELYSQPAADHKPGAMRTVTDWDTGKYLGEIPQPAHTYATIGNMNEHGLTICESTWGGRHELEGSGMIDYGSLIYITLQRARSAREAIDVMTSLVRDYGYASEGESFSIADPHEVWIMELIGKGKDDKGAVWVARRVPDDCISGHANHSRIHQFPKDDPNTLYSPDVIDFARQKGYFSGNDEDFSFSRAYAVTDLGALRGCDARVWAYYRQFTPEAAAYEPWVRYGRGEVMPLWFKATKKVGVDDLKSMMRDHFEGTPLDMNNDIGAGAYACPYRWRPLSFKVDSVEYSHERAIATQQTGFSFVASMNEKRPEAMKGILWFGVDDANTCVYVPVFNSTTTVPWPLRHGNGDLLTLSWESMFWVNNYVANQAYNRYSLMIDDIRKVQSQLETELTDSVKNVENTISKLDYVKSAELLQSLTDAAAADVTTKYRQLGDYLFVKYLDGNRKKESDGKFARNAYGMPEYPDFPGYDQRYYKSIVDETGDHFKVTEPECNR